MMAKRAGVGKKKWHTPVADGDAQGLVKEMLELDEQSRWSAGNGDMHISGGPGPNVESTRLAKGRRQRCLARLEFVTLLWLKIHPVPPLFIP